jgi:O-antigen/teichoic acid export membrane protein
MGFSGMLLSIVLAIIFIRAGLGATGAVVAQLLAGVIIAAISFIKIKPFITKTADKIKKFSIDIKSLTGYSLFYTIGTLSLVSTDVLTARMLLSPTDSGLYSALSILGRMILFGLTPIIALVIPLASHRQAAFGTAKSIFIKLGFVIVLFGLIGVGFFSLAPVWFIKILSGALYVSAAPLLPLFALSMFFFALSQFIVSYLLATLRPRATIFLIAASVIQPLLFALVGVSLGHVVTINFFLHLCLLISLSVFFFVPRPKA